MNVFLGNVALEGTTLRLGEATCFVTIVNRNATTVQHEMLNALIKI